MDCLEWTKIESENGFPYYYNKATGTKQWDHPRFRKIGQHLDDCNYVKYSIYRVALKFRVLQNALYMDDVSLQIISCVFNKHRLGANESSLCLESCELESVLYDIYFASNKKNNSNIDVDLATELMLNFLYNVYDPSRKGKMQVFSTKVLLAILSNSDMKEVYRYIFEECSDHNNCITRPRLHCFLSKIIEVMSYLHEDSSYGPKSIITAVENCFLNSPGFVGINETMFMSWVELHPKLIYWIAILHRIRIAEPVFHMVKCKSCKTTPIAGLCYKCTKCICYTQCQRCFFTGKTSNSHRLSHAMREYCTSLDNTPVTMKLFKKLFGILHCNNEKDESIIVDTKQFQIEKQSVVLGNGKEQCDVKPLSSPKTQLRIVIKLLETQTKELHQFLLSANLKEKDILRYLEEHRGHITAQVDKLKLLKDCISSNYYSPPVSRKSTRKRLLESTPLVPNNYKSNRNQNKSLDLLSPIISKAEIEFDNEEEKDVIALQGHETETSGTSGIYMEENGTVSYNIDDISTWIGGHPTNSTTSSNATKSDLMRRATSKDFHNELDEALAQLQQILANNIGLEDSLSHIDNTHLKFAMSEVEGMLTSFIDTVENSRSSSVRSKKVLDEENVTEL